MLFEDNKAEESSEKQDRYGEEYHDFPLELASIGLISILPLDVCRLFGLLHGEGVPKEFILRLNELLLPVELSLEIAGSFIAFLVLEGDECGHRFDDQVPLSLDQVPDFLIKLLQLLNLPLCDYLASLAEQVNYLHVFEGECDMRDLNLAL